MARNQARRQPDPIQTIKKLLLSGFVVCSFMAYVVIERLTRPDSPIASGCDDHKYCGSPWQLAAIVQRARRSATYRRAPANPAAGRESKFQRI